METLRFLKGAMLGFYRWGKACGFNGAENPNFSDKK